MENIGNFMLFKLRTVTLTLNFELKYFIMKKIIILGHLEAFWYIVI